MPNRIIREGILTSDRVDQLDAAGEVFYRRLMSKVDDYGRYDARLSILRSSLFPLRVDRVREADISRWMAACQKAGLLALYSHDGKPYLEMVGTGWQQRTPSKYPQPPVDNNCAQVFSNAHLVVDVGVVVVDREQDASPAAPPAPGPVEKQARATRLPDDWTLPDDWREWARSNRPDLDPSREADTFADFWHAKPGKDGRKLDWLATWRNWIRGARAQPGQASAPTAHKTVAQAMTPAETPLERQMGWLRQQRHVGAITDDQFRAEARKAQEKHAHG